MSGPEFFQTGLGRQFYEHDIPRIADALEKIAALLEKLSSMTYVLPSGEEQMMEVKLIKDIKYNGVLHKTGTKWKIEKGTAYLSEDCKKVYVISGYGSTMDLVLGKDAILINKNDH